MTIGLNFSKRQVGSPLSKRPAAADFGGIQEAEDMTTVVETDNTQEAIWVWCRYAELTGDYTTYLTNINNAWTYCNANPAWLEGDTPTNYYTTYNVGWGMQAEMKYRQIYGGRPEYVDHTSYGQTCARLSLIILLVQAPLPMLWSLDVLLVPCINMA